MPSCQQDVWFPLHITWTDKYFEVWRWYMVFLLWEKGVASPFSEINDAKLEIVLKPEVIDGFCMESHLPNPRPPFLWFLSDSIILDFLICHYLGPANAGNTDMRELHSSCMCMSGNAGLPVRDVSSIHDRESCRIIKLTFRERFYRHREQSKQWDWKMAAPTCA